MSEIVPEGPEGTRQAAVLVDYQNLHHYHLVQYMHHHLIHLLL